MPIFLTAAAALAVIALAFALYPLWRGKPMVGAITVGSLSLATALLYALIGTPAALRPIPTDAPVTTLDAAIAQLQSDLQREPNQPEGWRLLGRAYAERKQTTKARDAYARAAALAPDDADAQVDYAESRALATAQRRFDAEATALLETILQRHPQHQRARWFLGIAQRQAGRPADAARTWEPLLTQIDASTAAALRPQLDAARADAGLPPLPAAAPQAPASPNAITVNVALDPDFAARVRLRGDASVFVIARVPDGPPMPVAVEKHSLQELPLRVVLDDSDGPMPMQKLSALKNVEVIARLSASGNAIRQEDDLESSPVRVGLPATAPIDLTLGGQASPSATSTP
ncbi:MAG: tetratricopeptide repeat protein [Luteimonas sp.]